MGRLEQGEAMTQNNFKLSRSLVHRLVFGAVILLFFENICSGSQWTMMFYMAADNGLHGQALTDIAELQRISGQPGVDILVQLDSPSGAYRYEVLPRGTSTLASLGQINSGSPRALADFGVWAVKTCPAQRYLLVLWDHGNGWSKSSKFIGYDQQFNDFISVAGGELREAVGKISSTAGQPLDVVVFDACSMQMAEVLLELDGLCRYAVGSEALFPVEGMPYYPAWEAIDGNTPAESLAVRLATACNVFNELGYTTTCSAVDIDILSDATQNLRTLTGRLRQLPISDYVNPGEVSDSVLSFPPFASYDLPLMLDFIGRRSPEPERALTLETGRQFRNSILAQSITGSQYHSAQGLAVWYDSTDINFESGIESYHNLKWSGLSGWDKLLYQLIFQLDTSAAVPQDISLAGDAGGVYKLKWETGYDPAGVERYQIRHSQNMIIDFNDQGGSADSSNWDKAGFTIIPKTDGDTAYYSIGGQMTGKNAIQFDSSGNIGFTAEGINGSVTIESNSDSNSSWDTLGIWNYFGGAKKKYCSAKIKSTTATIRIGWNTSLAGWVYIDDIKVCHPDASRQIETIDSPNSFYNLSRVPGAAGFYQVRSVDSLQNQSSWSEARTYQPVPEFIRIWPNPFKDKISLLFFSSTERIQEVKIFNILGQYVDRMSMQKRTINGVMTESLYSWTPPTSMTDGVYIAQLKSDKSIRAVRIVMIR